MPIIEVITHLAAPPAICFQLALSVDLHTISTQRTQESIISGVSKGILKLNDSVTFRARHFGVWQTLTSQVTEFESPVYFADVMQKGAFKSMRHEHYFEATASGTLMRDVFVFESPLGWVGKLVDTLILKRYLQGFLEERCNVIKQYAESGRWQQVLPGKTLN
jgi:hypothetical protein